MSRTYLDFAQRKALENGVNVDFSLGYMDEAPTILKTQFDFVFNRICWNYGFSDRSFARSLFALVRPGGVGYVDTTHSDWRRETLSSSGRLRTWLNDVFAIKIGHPFPPHGRLASLFSRLPVDRMLVDYGMSTNDRILFRRYKGDR